MIEPQLMLIIVLSICLLCVTLGYVKLLLWTSSIFRGLTKFVLVLMIYVVYVVVLIAPLFYMISINHDAIENSVFAIFLVLLLYGVILAPSLYVVAHYKERLQVAGYFLERR